MKKKEEEVEMKGRERNGMGTGKTVLDIWLGLRFRNRNQKRRNITRLSIIFTFFPSHTCMLNSDSTRNHLLIKKISAQLSFFFL